MWTHLNWQKISAYSGGMPLAWSTVTRKVKMLPTSSWSARPSPRLSLVSAMLLSLRSEESHRGRLGRLALWFIENDLQLHLRLCFVICAWILSSAQYTQTGLCTLSRLHSVHIPSQSKKNCVCLISITIHLKTSFAFNRTICQVCFPLGQEVEIYERGGEGLAVVPMSLILLSSSEGVMTSELWPWPSTMRSSSRDKPERVITVEGKSFWLDKKEVGARAEGGRR